MANPQSNRNANTDELRDARRMLADAQRDTKKNGLRIDALARHARAEQQQSGTREMRKRR